MIRLNRVCKDYVNGSATNRVLNNIDLRVERGEFIAVMGTSGSGKTTLLNLIGGIDSLTEGEYWFDEVEVNKLSRKELDRFRTKHIGFVFQQFALMTEYSVYENAELPLLANGVPVVKRKKMTMDALELLGIDNLAKQNVCRISGGEQQRCAIARAILTNGEVILCDEPTGALDRQNSKMIMECLKKINTLGKTIVLVTHDRAMAEYADRIYYLEDGNLSEVNTLEK